MMINETWKNALLSSPVFQGLPFAQDFTQKIINSPVNIPTQYITNGYKPYQDWIKSVQTTAGRPQATDFMNSAGIIDVPAWAKADQNWLKSPSKPVDPFASLPQVDTGLTGSGTGDNTFTYRWGTNNLTLDPYGNVVSQNGSPGVYAAPVNYNPDQLTNAAKTVLSSGVDPITGNAANLAQYAKPYQYGAPFTQNGKQYQYYSEPEFPRYAGMQISGNDIYMPIDVFNKHPELANPYTLSVPTTSLDISGMPLSSVVDPRVLGISGLQGATFASGQNPVQFKKFDRAAYDKYVLPYMYNPKDNGGLGGLGGLLGGAILSMGLGSFFGPALSQAFGGSTWGNIAAKAITSGLSSALSGGNPIQSMVTGGLSGALNTGLQNILPDTGISPEAANIASSAVKSITSGNPMGILSSVLGNSLGIPSLVTQTLGGLVNAANAPDPNASRESAYAARAASAQKFLDSYIAAAREAKANQQTAQEAAPPAYGGTQQPPKYLQALARASRAQNFLKTRGLLG